MVEANHYERKNGVVLSKEEDVAHADKEKLLVCTNLIIHQEDNNVQQLHHNIFRTQSTSHARICDVVVDSTSFKNDVPASTVEKLTQNEDHPKFYKFTWFDKKNKVSTVLFSAKTR